jgi:hypothetical protein
MVRAAFFAAALAGGAHTYTLTPAGAMTAQGSLLATAPGASGDPRPARWTLTVGSSGGAKITGMTWSANPGPVTFTGFPWPMVATNVSAIMIRGVTWVGPAGTCGPMTLKGTLSRGTIGVTYYDGACQFVTGAATNPVMAISTRAESDRP